MSDHELISGCRSCGNPELEDVLGLGLMPLSDGLVRAGADRSAEPRYPLTLAWCPGCTLAQIRETVDPRTLFGAEYPYYSSYSPALVEHARSNVEAIIDETGVDGSSLVVELASNDGYLLQWFVKEGVPVLGIDPAPGPAAAAEARDVPTICDFFDVALANRLVAQGRQADVIIGNNVLAHVPDQNSFVAAIENLLAPSGLVVMEFPYLRDLVEKAEFDTIYHEHHCYFSVASARELFRRHRLELVSVEHTGIHGGSLRARFRRFGTPDATVARMLDSEREAGLGERSFYEGFADRVEGIRDRLVTLLAEIRGSGATIAAYGAAAKGAIMLNYCGIDERTVEYVVDRNDHKQGWEMPGVPIPIRSPEDLRSDPPDYLLILAWNFKEEIMAQQSWFAEAGGRFIVPIPEPVVV